MAGITLFDGQKFPVDGLQLAATSLRTVTASLHCLLCCTFSVRTLVVCKICFILDVFSVLYITNVGQTIQVYGDLIQLLLNVNCDVFAVSSGVHSLTRTSTFDGGDWVLELCLLW